MVTIPTKAVALALLLVVPPPPAPAPPSVPAPPETPAPPATPRAVREVVVVNDDDVAAFDSDEDSVVVHSGHGRMRGFIGVRLMDLTPDLRAHFGAPRDAGVMVSELDSNSPAAKAGVAVGDIITAADGERIGSPGELSRLVRRKKGGDSVKLDVFRDRSAKHLSVVAEERRMPFMDLGEVGELGRLSELGPEIHARVMREFGHARPRIEIRRDRLERKLDQMRKRLDEIEKELSKSRD